MEAVDSSPILAGMSRPAAIEVRDLHKSFRVPGRRAPATLRARLRNPTGRMPGRTLDVLRGLSFEIGQGEFFGIVGRNGSGKSTLLKLLASVYGADRGSIRVAGRLAPFLELGVGFNPELPALDNVVLNGVMMGLSPRRRPPPLRRDRRVRRAQGLHRPPGQELLLGDEGPARRSRS